MTDNPNQAAIEAWAEFRTAFGAEVPESTQPEPHAPAVLLGWEWEDAILGLRAVLPHDPDAPGLIEGDR